MTTTDAQIADIQHQLDQLRQESSINNGLIAGAVRRARLGLAVIEQAGNVARLQSPISTVGWDPRQGAFSHPVPTQPLADRMNAGGGAGEAAAPQTTLLLGDATAAFDAILLTAIQLAMLEMGPGNATYDIRLVREAAKTWQIDDAAGGPARLWLAGDEVQILNAAYAIAYNGDGTVAAVTRSGAQGAANTVVNYSGPGVVSSIVTTRGGKTVTVTPTYTGAQITALARAVA